MTRTNLCLLPFAFLFICPALAQPPSRSQSQFWAAQWISDARVPERGEAVLQFRKRIDLVQKPQRFLVDVSADNQFIFYVNGKPVGRGPSRSDLAHWRYETYDIAPFLQAGSNVLAATVWNFATHSAIAQMSDRTAFLIHGQSETESVASTNDTWDVAQDRSITTIRPAVHGYYAAEPGERIDAKFDVKGNGEAVEDSAFVKATPIGRAVLREGRDAPNNWQLVGDPLPKMEMTEVPPGKVVRAAGIAASPGFPDSELSIPARAEASILIDHGELTTGYPALTVTGGQGAAIALTYAEALVDESRSKGNRDRIEGKHIEGLTDEFFPSGSPNPYEFIPLAWRTWRYLQLDIKTSDQPLLLKALRTWFTAYPFEERARFRSDDLTLKAIWDVGWRTARLDAHDTYMDTPYWERLQYIGDTRIQALLSYVVAGDDRLARQAVEAFNNSRIPDGLTQSRYPSSLVQMIPTFSLLWIGMVHDFWLYRGDSELIRSQLPGVRSVLDWYLHRQRADGLLSRLPWWPFVDWGKDFSSGMPPQDGDGGSSIITLQLVEALRYAAELERAYGDAHEAEKYEAAAKRASEAVWKLCWNQQHGLLADTPAQQHYSQHAGILGVWLDVIPPAQQKEVLTKILSSSDSGFTATGTVPPMTIATYYFRFYLARALEHAGMGDDYLRLLGPWRRMLSLGLTTWAESPEPTRSDSHAWSAHPNYDLLTIVAGIHPQAPGFGSVEIAPHLGMLKHVDAVMPTPKGSIAVEYQKEATGVSARITLPAGITGNLIWNGAKLALHEGAQQLRLEQ